MKNVKAWNQIIKAYRAANDLLSSLDGIEAWDKEFYEQESLATEQEKVLAIVERLQLLHMQYGAEISGGDEDF